MGIIAEFSIPSEEFALYETLVSVPEMIAEVERVVAHESDRIMPLFWTRGGSHAEFEAVAADDPSVRNVTKLDESDDAVLYRAEWVEHVETVAYAYTETGATILGATGQNERWNLQLRFDDQESLSTFRAYLDEKGYEFPDETPCRRTVPVPYLSCYQHDRSDPIARSAPGGDRIRVVREER